MPTAEVGAWSLRRFVVIVFMLAFAGCAEQQIRDKAQDQARAGDYQSALTGLQAGVAKYPESAILRAALIETRTEAVSRVIAEAAAARSRGQFDVEEAVLRRAILTYPDSDRIANLIATVDTTKRQRDALNEAEALVRERKLAPAARVVAEALKANPKQSDLLALQRRIELEQRQLQLKASQRTLSETRPISLDFRDASLRSVLDLVSRNSGINFILDKDIRAETRVTVFLQSARVEDALDLITSTYQLSKKVIDSRTILVYPNTPEKQREHQEQIVKVFYLANGDAKGAAAFLKSMLRIREPFVDERSNMLSLRESQENIQLAERLVALFDAGDPEVLIEAEIIEINTSRLLDLGINFPNTFSLTLLPPGADTGLTLGNIRGVTRDRIALDIGGITVNLNRTTGDYNTLASPRIRVKSKEKAKVLVGDKIPLVTTTISTGGFVSDSVNYLDVGLKLEVEPTVYLDDEVAIKLALEVSSLGTVVKTASGTQAYQIGTRNANTTLRLRDGETQLLAGLISTQERNDANKVPLLGDLPVAGRIFSSQRDSSQRTELVLSITPHILRNIRRPDVTEGELWVGTETVPRLRPVGGSAASAGDEAGNEATRLQSDGSVMAGGSSELAPRGAVRSTVAAPTVQWAGPPEVKVGETFTATLALQSTQPLRGAPIRLAYNKDKLEVLGIEEGDFFKQGGSATSFTRAVDQPLSQLSAGVLRNQASGASGQGTFLILKLKALAAGAGEVSIQSMEPIGLAGPVAKPTVLPAFRVLVQ